MLLNSKIDKYSYTEDLSKTDYFPYTRKLFSDGVNSALNFILGFLSAHEPMVIPIFLGYEMYKYKPYDSTTTEVEEYTLGFVFGCAVPLESLLKSSKKAQEINPLLYDLFDLAV